MNMFFRIALIAMPLMLSMSVMAQTDVLLGANGERLVGRVIEEKDGSILFDSDSLGRIRVPAGKMQLQRATPVAEPATPAEPSVRWNAEVSGKIAVDRGSLQTPEERLDVSFKLDRKTDRHAFYSTLAYNYKRKNGLMDDDDWLLSLSDDKFISDEHFLSARLLATQELTSTGTDDTLTLSAAYGWRLWETSERYLRIGPALGYLSLSRDTGEFKGPAAGLYTRALWPVFAKSTLSAELQALESFNDGSYVNLDLRLRRPMSEHFFVGVGWNYAWSDVELESGVTSKWRWDFGWKLDP
jgi:putative salt-induced outer membrane protein YdiY